MQKSLPKKKSTEKQGEMAIRHSKGSVGQKGRSIDALNLEKGPGAGGKESW